ncbi:DNA fragmentation factor-related protein 4 isoform X2 [Cotesia typhae]|uniref:DNA fragmentation factor-related protein 4 isoform X2 n=1 Tax=Cotesia typhae TaxID=2053667 RepID=UPI003D6893BD
MSFTNFIAQFTSSKVKHELKGFKITDVNRTRKVGIASRSLQELKQKACLKFNVTNDIAEINIYLLDGSLIDDNEYFHTLESQTTLILQKPGEKLFSDADLLYEILKKVNIDHLTAGEQAYKFLLENLKKKVAILNSVLNTDDSKTAFSKREDHPEWFKGLESNVLTKEAYMHRRCQDRIRGYLYKAIEQIKASNTWLTNHEARVRLYDVINYFKLQLKEDHYFGYYFDRSRAYKKKVNHLLDITDGAYNECYSHCPCQIELFKKGQKIDQEIDALEDEIDAKKVSLDNQRGVKKITIENKKIPSYKIFSRKGSEEYALCDGSGEFKCQGVWNATNCAYGEKHKINPYRSYEELVLFSTWNLDHKIERSRTLVPQLIKLSEEDLIKSDDIYECYSNLFTIKNLNLVHIICHDKGSHMNNFRGSDLK